MTALSKATLKAIWVANFKPMQGDFANLIDSWMDANYTAGISGAVERSTNAKLLDTVSVKDFGAIGDGTGNDAPAFQLAINASSSVYVPSGLYRFSTLVTIPSNRSIVMDDAATIIAASAFTCMKASAKSETWITLGTVSAAASTISDVNTSGVNSGDILSFTYSIYNGDTVSVVSVTTSAVFLANPLAFQYGTSPSISRTTPLRNISITGGKIQSAGQNTPVRFSGVDGVTIESLSTWMINFTRCVNGTLSNCVVSNSGLGLGTGAIRLISCSNFVINGNRVSVSGAGSQLKMEGVSYATISNNIMVGNSTFCFPIDAANIAETVISSNVMSGWEVRFAPGSAILASNVIDAPQVGIRITQSSAAALMGKYMVVTGNTVRAESSCVVATGEVDRLVITGNDFSSRASTAAEISSSVKAGVSIFSQNTGSASNATIQQDPVLGAMNAGRIGFAFSVITTASANISSITNGYEGQVITFKTNTSTQTVLFQDGIGNLRMAGDFTLDNDEDTITFIRVGGNWLEIARSNNGA